MASKKNRILKVLACFGALAVLCAAGAFVFASAEKQVLNNYSNNEFSRGYYTNASSYGKSNYNFTNNLVDFSIPSSNTSNSSYKWTLLDFSTTTTYSEDVPGTEPVINGFIPGNSYEITLSIDFAIQTDKSVLNTDYNWQAIKKYMDDNIYLGNNSTYFTYNQYSGPTYTSYHNLLTDIENFELKQSNLSVSEAVIINSNNKYFPISYSASLFFTVPLDLPTNATSYIHLSMFFNNAMFYNSYVNYLYTSQLSRLRLTGYEYTNGDLPEESSADTSDPGGGSGDTSDNGVSDIVEGQKEAVEHGQDLEQSKAQAELDDQNENLSDFQSVFNVTTLGSSFGNLLQGLMYSGQDFSFKFPGSGNIPYLDQNQELWQELEIPFKTYIDAIPSSIMVIIRFLAWFALAVYLFHLFKKVLSYFRGGSDD